MLRTVAETREGRDRMKITPLDIRHKEFKRGLRGYVDVEVDEFLDEVADEFERLFKENMELTERLEAVNEKVAGYRRIEDALQKTLVSAQASSEEVKQNAAKTAQLMLHEAELKARQLMNESYSERQAVEHATAKLRSAEQEFRFKFREMLQSYLKQAEEPPPARQRADSTSDTQAELARQASAIREAIEREEANVADADAERWPDETVPEAGETTEPSAQTSPEHPDEQPPSPDEQLPSEDEQPPSPHEPPSVGVAVGPGRTDRILFGERDDLLADVDGEVSENEFKW